ncbi:MAG: 50S ribosomal protein L28 [Arsenophonus sp.]|nr:MAG: 50S ribosomal protein L28 [Arsenophonus sp.]
MSQICQITKKKTIYGQSRSHAMNAKKRRFLLNLHIHKFWSPLKKKFVNIRVSAKGIRFIDKKGIDYFIIKKIIK